MELWWVGLVLFSVSGAGVAWVVAGRGGLWWVVVGCGGSAFAPADSTDAMPDDTWLMWYENGISILIKLKRLEIVQKSKHWSLNIIKFDGSYRILLQKQSFENPSTVYAIYKKYKEISHIYRNYRVFTYKGLILFYISWNIENLDCNRIAYIKPCPLPSLDH